MKKILFISLIFFSAFIKNADAQTTGVPDTLAYLQTIVANKSQYIGQPFSILLNSLQVQIKHFSRNTDIVYDISKETSTSFGFYFPQNNNEIYLTYPRLRISWQPYLNATQSDVLWKNNNGGGWSSLVAAFYVSGIIADIQVRE